MFAALALLFLVVPFAELYVIIQIGAAIGALPTIAILVVDSLVGAWLVKREGLAVVRRAQAQVQRGVVPGTELVDGVLILFAGALMLTPGFITDILAIFLLIPPVRVVVRRILGSQLAKRATFYVERF